MNFKFFLFLLVILCFSFSAVIQVNKTAGGCGQTLASSNRTNLTDAISVAAVGDTIYVCGGNVAYNETITLNKSLNFFGNESGVIITAASPSVAAVSINASNINITNFTIDGASSTSPVEPAAINLSFASFVNIYNVTVNRSYTGIQISHSENISLHNNTIKDVSTYGIRLTNSNFSNITYNLIYNSSSYGMSLVSGSRFNNISNNRVTFSITGAGIFLSSSSSNNLSYNIVNGTSTVVYAGYNLESSSENNTLSYNIAESNANTGFRIVTSHNNTFLYNNATNNTNYGFSYTTSQRNNLSYNNASKNRQYGFLLTASTDNSLQHNDAFNNTLIGFILSTASNSNNLTSNNASKHTQYGLATAFSSKSNNFTSNIAYDNSILGFLSSSSISGNYFNSNYAYNNSRYGFAFSTDNGSTLSLNNATNNTLAQYHFESDSNATFTGINWAFNTPQLAFDLNVTQGSNVSALVGTTFYNFTTSYGTFFFANADNVSIKLMNISDAGPSVYANRCATFTGTCSLITISSNVINITNTSAGAFIDLGMFYDTAQTSGVASTFINVSRYNLTANGWESIGVGQSLINTALGTVRIDSVTLFSTFGVVKYDSATSSASTSGQSQTDELILDYSFECTDGSLKVSAQIENTKINVIQTFPDFVSIDEKLTDSSGDAYFTILQDGTYRIRATKSGYYAAQLNNIELSLCKVEPLKVQCNTNNDCDLDKFCSNGQCIEVKGTCGYADKHEWVKYECCSDSECNEGYLCTLNKCILGTTILEDPEMLKAQEKINEISKEIEKAKSEGTDVTNAKNKLKEAQDAFDKEDYEMAQSLAQEAMQLIKRHEITMVDKPKTDLDRPLVKKQDNLIFLFALGIISLVVIGLVLTFYFLARKKR